MVLLNSFQLTWYFEIFNKIITEEFGILYGKYGKAKN